MTADPLLTGRMLSLGYHGRALIRDLSFEVRRGEILGVVGPNGSGKTTLLRTILGLLKPLEGTVERRADLTISYMPQRERIDTILPVTALEVVLMARSARAGALQRIRGEDRDACRSALARVGGQTLSDQLYRNLSGGQQQRVLLARAIAADSEMLILDEPTAGMDVASEAAMIGFLQELNQDLNLTVIIVTHLLPIVLNLASSVMLLGARRVLHGPVGEVFQETVLSELYGAPVHIGTVAGKRTLVVDRPGGRDV
ncbi:MAG TPA: metal ABC transporter ATP-binding protein [Bryobacteraceae bacterium]|nr:metal ABC transporter ATP-binding protein [Bryobacteraceae bacterium]